MTLLFALLLFAPQANEARDLIEKIRSGSLVEREEASHRLKVMGKGAAAELEKAAKDPDAAFAARAQVLLERLRLMDTLSQDLQKSLPGLADRLAFGTDRHWTKALKHAEELLRPGSRLPLIPRAELELLAPRAARGAEPGDDRSDICRIIRDRRLASAMPELVRYLDDPDEDVREEAVEVMRRIPCAEGIRRLRERARNEGPAMRAEAIRFLRNLRCREAAPDAVHLVGDPDVKVRAAGASALAPLLGKEAAAELTRLLKDPDGGVRQQAIYGLLRLYEKESGLQLVKLLDDPDETVRRAAAYALGEMRIREAIPRLVELLREEKLGVRNEAAEALRDLRAREAVPVALKEYVRLLPSGDVDELDPLEDLLLALAPREGAEAAAPFLKHENPDTRACALWLLAEAGAGVPAAEIRALLKDKDRWVRTHAADAAGSLGLREAIPDLEDMLGGSREERHAAIDSLAQLEAKVAIPKLIDLLKNKEVRGRAAEALARLGAKGAAKPIAHLLKNEPAAVGAEEVRALAHLEGRAAAPLIAPFIDTANNWAWYGALECLAHLEAWDEAPRVELLLEDRDPDVRSEAAAWLARAGSRRGVELLLEDEDSDLWTLNALRRPDAWKKLQSVRVATRRTGTMMEKLRALAKDTGFTVEVEPGPLGDAARWFDRPAGVTEYEYPMPLGDALIGVSPHLFEMVLEADRIRFLPEDAARRFWRDWWKEGGPTAK